MPTTSSPEKTSSTSRGRQPPTTVALVLLFLSPFLLPGLFFSLLVLTVFSFLLFLPTACVLTSTFLLWAFLRPRLLPALPRLVSGHPPSWPSPARPAGRGSQPDGVQECIELDRSELPSTDESEEEERVVIEEAAATAMRGGEEISMDLSFWQIYLVTPGEHARGKNRFYELLSFWKGKEKGRV